MLSVMVQCKPVMTQKQKKKQKKEREGKKVQIGRKCLCNFFLLRRSELSSKDPIPETAGDAEPILVILVMVLEVVSLELFVEGG